MRVILSPPKTLPRRPGEAALSGAPGVPPGLILPILGLVAASALWIALFGALKVDDAYITFRLAQVAHDFGRFQWNPGGPAVEGMTSLLWAILLVPFAGSLETVPWVAKVLGCVCGLAGVALLLSAIHRVGGARATRWGVLWIALCPALYFHFLNAMETGLAVLLVAAMLWTGLTTIGEDARGIALRRGPAVGFGVAWLLAGMTRPELVLYGALFAGVTLGSLRAESRRSYLTLLAIAFLLPGLVYFVARWRYFGHLLPLPAYVKVSGSGVSNSGVGYVALSFAGLTGGPALLAVMGGVLARRDPGVRISARLAWPAVALMAFFLFVNPVMGLVYRFMIPPLVPLVAAAALALPPAMDASRTHPWMRRVLWAALFLTAGQFLSASVPARHWATVNTVALTSSHIALGRALASVSERGRAFVLNDIGAVSYYSRWDTAEGIGLVTPAVSIERKPLDTAMGEFDPDVLVVSGYPMNLPSPHPEFHGYEFIGYVPWLVFRDVGGGTRGCVYARNGYARTAALRSALVGVGAPVFEVPWYFKAYRRLKSSFRQ